MVHDFFIIIILKSYWVWHNKWIAKRKIVIALNQWINTKLFQLFCFDKIFSSTTKKEKKIYSQEWAECPIALWLEKLNFFCAGAVPPKVCRVLPPLSSSSLHPPLESIMSAGQALWAVQAAVPALRGEPHCHHLTWWQGSWQLCHRAGSRPYRTSARLLSISLRFASLAPISHQTENWLKDVLNIFSLLFTPRLWASSCPVPSVVLQAAD